MEQMECILDDVRVEYDLGALATKLRLRPNSKPLARLAALAEEAVQLARPRAAFKVCDLEFGAGDDVLAGGQRFTSPLLRENLKGLSRVFPYLATEGPELAQWGRAFADLDRVLANALENQAMAMARNAMENFILEKFAIEQVSAMNPGSLTVWPITQQTALFELLHPLDEQIKITLLPSFMMKPEHTVSGLYFQTDSKFHNCQLCPRDDCPNRQAPYEGMA